MEEMTMSVCIELPAALEAALRSQISDLDQTAKQALLLDLYRSEKITRHELGAALGIDRFSVDELLNRYGVTEDLPTAAEICQEADEVEQILGRQNLSP